MNLQTWNLKEAGETKICASLPYPLPSTLPTLFPIWRDDDWEDTTFISSQSVDTIFLFYFAVLLYALLLIPNTVIIVLMCISIKLELTRDLEGSKFRIILVKLLSLPRIIHYAIELILIGKFKRAILSTYLFCIYLILMFVVCSFRSHLVFFNAANRHLKRR